MKNSIKKALMIIPAFNEGGKLETVGSRLKAAINVLSDQTQIDGLIVDDGSSNQVAKEVAEANQFIYLRNERQCGVGHAIRKAYAYGLEHGYDVLMTMAGNNKDEPLEMERLLVALNEGADFVQGSRYLPGGKFGCMPIYRQLATRWMHPLLFSVISGKRITDSTNGFRAIRSGLLASFMPKLQAEWLDHYELEPYLFCQSIRCNYDVREVPVSKIYPEKKLGYSKMRPFVDWWSILKPLFILALSKKDSQRSGESDDKR